MSRSTFLTRQAQNAKLLNDVKTLETMLIKLNKNLDEMTRKLDNSVKDNSKMNLEKQELERKIADLLSFKKRNDSEIERYSQENQVLHRNCQEKEVIIDKLEEGQRRLVHQFEELSREAANLNNKAVSQKEEISGLKGQLEESHALVVRLNVTLREKEIEISRLLSEVDRLNKTNSREVDLRRKKEEDYENVTEEIYVKEREINKLSCKLREVEEEREKMRSEIEKKLKDINETRTNMVVIAEHTDKV